MNTNNGSSLTEEWPQTRKPIKKKSVTFSDYSSLKKYVKDLDYQAIKAYKSNEAKEFKAQAINEGVRIQALISYLSCGTGTAMKYLIEKGYLTPEELVGIENLVVKTDEVARKVALERKAHAPFVLSVQKQLRERSVGSASDNAAVLASAAAANSKKHVKRANLRALL